MAIHGGLRGTLATEAVGDGAGDRRGEASVVRVSVWLTAEGGCRRCWAGGVGGQVTQHQRQDGHGQAEPPQCARGAQAVAGQKAVTGGQSGSVRLRWRQRSSRRISVSPWKKSAAPGFCPSRPGTPCATAGTTRASALKETAVACRVRHRLLSESALTGRSVSVWGIELNLPVEGDDACTEVEMVTMSLPRLLPRFRPRRRPSSPTIGRARTKVFRHIEDWSLVDQGPTYVRHVGELHLYAARKRVIRPPDHLSLRWRRF